jgi:hypothetical protein
MEESSDALDSAVYAAELYNQIKQEQMMGLNSIMGQGMIGNAANSLMGSGGITNGAISNAQQASWNAAQLAQAKSSYPYKENKPRVSMELSIIQADNGFIVNIGEEQYTGRTPHVAMTIEDVCTIITSQLASRMLDRTE